MRLTLIKAISFPKTGRSTEILGLQGRSGQQEQEQCERNRHLNSKSLLSITIGWVDITSYLILLMGLINRLGLVNRFRDHLEAKLLLLSLAVTDDS